MDEKWKDKLIGYLMIVIFALFSFGVVKVCESISKNSDLIGKIFILKADKEDFKHEIQLLWKEIDRLKK